MAAGTYVDWHDNTRCNGSSQSIKKATPGGDNRAPSGRTQAKGGTDARIDAGPAASDLVLRGSSRRLSTSNHAEDYIFADLTFVALLEQLAPEEGVAGIVVMTDEAHMPETNLANVHCYETLLAGGAESFDWPALDENAASSLCYTSGTTGNPKGVLYSHRSTVLHTYAACMRDVIGLGADDVVMPVVPMFHANSWGIAYAAPMSGAKLVLPGPRMDGASIHELMRGERVTVSAGVPTVWLMLLQYLRESGESLPDFKRCVIGGSAAPRSMIEAFETEYDTTVLHAWGMTDMSPLGVVGTMTPELLQLPYERQLD